MISVEKVRELVIEPLAKNRPGYVYAASGLVRLENRVFIIADDELHMAEFDVRDSQPGNWIKLLPGVLPIDYSERKKVKPDLETITHLQPYEHAPHGALLVVPSMSRPNRVTGVILNLNQSLSIDGAPLPIDFSDICKKLTSSIDGLNIEGITVQQKTTKLFHRGSRSKGKSVVIELDTKGFLRDLHDTHAPKSENIIGMKNYDLGEISGVELSFTDAIPLSDGRIVFLATAEATDDEYQDGASLGSSLGIMKENGEIERITRISGKDKFEGICVDNAAKTTGGSASTLDILLVSDTDNEKIPSNLYRGSISLN